MSNKPYKIGIDCRMYSKNFTGIGRYIDQLIQNLSKIDTKNTYLLYLNKDDYNQFITPAKNFQKILVNAPQYSLREQTNFLFTLIKTKPDLVHFTNFNQPILNAFKSITTIHDLTLHFYPGRKFQSKFFHTAYKFIILTALTKSKSIISISKNTQKDLHKLYPKYTSKINVIHNGFATNFLNTKKQNSLNLPDDYILYTGNWREHKNITNLIKAFQILKNKFNYQGKLVLTGNPNPLYPEPIQEIKKHKLEKHIIQLGLVEEKDLPEIYQRASVYIFPSLYEGFGLPILESFASKTPVVASNIASIPEVGGKGCLYFDPHNPDNIAEITNKVLTDKSLQNKLILEGQKQLNKFSFHKMTTQTHQLYLAALQKNKPT